MSPRGIHSPIAMVLSRHIRTHFFLFYYVALRAPCEPDAFPVSDLVLRRAAAMNGTSVHVLEERAEAWRPWRDYAAVASVAQYNRCRVQAKWASLSFGVVASGLPTCAVPDRIYLFITYDPWSSGAGPQGFPRLEHTLRRKSSPRPGP
jgi:hypothetical protein